MGLIKMDLSFFYCGIPFDKFLGPPLRSSAASFLQYYRSAELCCIDQRLSSSTWPAPGYAAAYRAYPVGPPLNDAELLLPHGAISVVFSSG
jgi:hypothetical protein